MLRVGCGPNTFGFYLLLSLYLSVAPHVESSARAQGDGARSPGQRPGVWHQGKFLGYQPRHLARQLPDREIDSADKTRSDSARAASGPERADAPAASGMPAGLPARQVAHAPQLPPTGPGPGTYSHSHRQATTAMHVDSLHEAHATRRHSATEISPLLGLVGQHGGGGYHDGSCMDDSCLDGGCFEPHRSSRIWGRAEYLLWWTRGMETPTLASTSIAGTPRPQAGVLGQSGTRELFGDSPLGESTQSGARFTLGAWLNDDQCQGLEVTYLYVGEGTDNFHASQADYPILARPFFNTQANAQDVRLINFPGDLQGNLAIGSATEFQTLEILLRHAAVRSPVSKMDYLFGYRYARLRDELNIDSSSRALSGATTGSTLSISDEFGTRNRFHGFEVGLTYEWRPTPLWEAELLAKVALGRSSANLDIWGETVTTSPTGTTASSPSGLLARTSNSGSFETSRFGALSEFGVNLHRDLQCGLKFSVGYSFIHWGSVNRAGDQIDVAVNPAELLPGNANNGSRPMNPGGKSSYWAQGLNFGLTYDF